MAKRPNRKSASRPVPDFETEVRIEKVVAEGDGFGHLQDGRVIFVEGGLPGELVLAKLVQQSKDYARAVVTKVLEPSTQRVQPPCPYVSLGCGGCDLQHASIPLQRQIKVDIVRESLVRLAKISEPDVRLFDSSELPVIEARTTLRIARARGGGVGFRQRHSHEVTAVTRCMVAHGALNELLPVIGLVDAEEVIIRVGVASGERMAWAEPSESIVGLPIDVALGKSAVVHENICGHDFVISAESFFQSSPQAATALVDATRRALGDMAQWEAGSVIDAYCGVGLFAATVFPLDRHVIAIEANAAACADARLNLAGRDVEVVQSAVEQWSPVCASVVVADPARDGLRAAGVEVLVATKAPVMVLISCDPASLGRDARLLSTHGYHLEYSEVLDLFPHTHHVEVVSRFIRTSVPETE